MTQPDTDDPPAKTPANTPARGMPDYRGAPLDPARGPGLGCFWIQIVMLAILLVATPISVWLVAPPWFSAALLILSLILLLFVGQTTIFLLRLVAVDRRSRRRPISTSARPTVGQLEDEGRAAGQNDAPVDGRPDDDQPDRS